MQGTGGVDSPRAVKIIGVGQTNRGTLVVGEVEVVAAQRRVDPVGDPDQ